MILMLPIILSSAKSLVLRVKEKKIVALFEMRAIYACYTYQELQGAQTNQFYMLYWIKQVLGQPIYRVPHKAGGTDNCRKMMSSIKAI